MKQKLIKTLTGIFVVCMIIPLLAFGAKALGGNGSFNLVEVNAGLISKENQKIGNDEWFSGKALPAGDKSQDFAIMKTSNEEFVYCIEPGVVSQNGDNYGWKSLDSMFRDIQKPGINDRTSAINKMRWTARLLSLVNDYNRYDRYDGHQIEVRLQHMAIQTLIWEVVCGERDANFNYVGAKYGYSNVQSLMTVNKNYEARFFELKKQYEEAMKSYNKNVSKTSYDEENAPIIRLDWDSFTNRYQTTFTDKNNVAKWYKWEGDNNISVNVVGDQVTISTSVANYTSNVIGGFNSMFRANMDKSGSSPETYITGHATEKRAQYTVTANSIKDPVRNSFFKAQSVSQHSLDLNGILDGEVRGNIAGWGTADIYINGEIATEGNDVTDFNKKFDYGTKYEIKDIRAKDGKMYTGTSATISGTITKDTEVRLPFATACNLDLNGLLDLTQKWDIYGYGTADVYINGTRVADDVNDFNGTYPKGTKFEFKDIKALSGKKYMGVQSGSISGTLNGNNSVNLDIRTLYTIKYDDTEGVGAPASQTKTFGIDIGLSKTKPTREGWTFNGWNTSRNGSGTKYNPGDTYKANANVTLYAQWINYPPIIDAPELGYDPNNPNDPNYPDVPSNIPPYIEGGKIIVQKGDPVNPLDYVKAKDEEDGEITNKVVIVKDPIPRDAHQNTSVAGEYIVDVKVTDKAGATATGKVNIIVNDPPIVVPEDRYFYKDSEVTADNLLEQVISQDKEDGDITRKVTVVEIKYHDRIEKNPSHLDTSVEGVFEIIYTVTDSYKKTTTNNAPIHVVSSTPAKSPTKTFTRFISKEFINTLEPTSIWVTNNDYASLLNNSLNSETPIEVWKFTHDEVLTIKEFIRSTPPSQEKNIKFMELFGYGRKE